MKACSTCGNRKPDQKYYLVRSGPRSGKRRSSCIQCERDSGRKRNRVRSAGRIGVSVEKYIEILSALKFPERLSSVLSDVQPTKKCPRCLIEKGILDFRIYTPQDVRRQTLRCRECCVEFKRDNERWRHLRKTYGITKGEYISMEGAQGGVCAICKSGELKLGVDHCHKTGSIRGLLCTGCNVSLGWLERNLEATKGYLLGQPGDSDGCPEENILEREVG